MAILRRRCPRCLTGRVFRGLFTMNETCPLCDFPFGREEGYFVGAMYVSYALSLPILFAIFLVLWLFSSKTLLATGVLSAVAAVIFLPLVPIVFQYSRVLWMHFDWLFGPDRRRPPKE
jgi:uncharacterized protein (DUF983 family)